tara:strand:- start:136 stop:393 length:258 start_codon:yes stop_codon:yes gene_type:complete
MESLNENVKIYNMIKENVSPDYYARYDIEPVSFIMRNNIPYAEGNVIKYVLRHDMKGGREDIDKAIRYLEMIKEEKYSGKSQEVS